MNNKKIINTFFIIMIAITVIMSGCSKDSKEDTQTQNFSEDNSTNITSSPSENSGITGQANENNNKNTEMNTEENIILEETTVQEEENATMQEQTTASEICKDTDGGLNYEEKGTATLKTGDSTKTYTDYCRHGSSEGQLFEYYCDGDVLASNSYDCPKGCNNNGACYT